MMQPNHNRSVIGSISEEFERRGQAFECHLFQILYCIDRSLGLSQRLFLGIGMARDGLINFPWGTHGTNRKMQKR